MIRQLIKTRMRTHLEKAQEAKEANDEATVFECFLRHSECREILKSMAK